MIEELLDLQKLVNEEPEVKAPRSACSGAKSSCCVPIKRD